MKETYLLSTKFEANNMKRLNSLPWQEYPAWAISYAKRPNPAPGTKICTSPILLDQEDSEVCVSANDSYISRTAEVQSFAINNLFFKISIEQEHP